MSDRSVATMPEPENDKIFEILDAGHEENGRMIKAVKFLRSEQNDLKKDQDTLKHEFKDFKETHAIDPYLARGLNKAHKKRGIELMGGKESPAYKNEKLRRSVYRTIWEQYYVQFGVPSYQVTRENQIKEAREWLLNWMPPYDIKESIKIANNGWNQTKLV